MNTNNELSKISEWVKVNKLSLKKVWSTVKIRETRLPQKAIVPVGRPRPYSIIILNMRFIPEASLSSQITASSYILERHLWVNNSKHFALTPTWWLACKQTGCITAGIWKLLDPKSLYWHSVITKHLYDFMQCWPNVKNVGPALYKCYTNVLCLLGCRGTFSQTLYIYSMLVQCWASVAYVGPALDQCLVLVVSCNQFSGYINAVNVYSIGNCWPTLDRPRHAHFAVEH